MTMPDREDDLDKASLPKIPVGPAETPVGPAETADVFIEEWPEPAGGFTQTDEPQAVQTRTATARRAILVGARVVAGTIGIAATVATIAAATLLPLPSHQSAAPSASVIPVPAAQQRVCAGPLLRLGDDTGAFATTASAVGSARVNHAASGGTVAESRIENTDEPSGRSAAVLGLPPTGGAGEPVLLSGNQTQTIETGDLVGLAAAECSEARNETWLVGGATDTGRTTLITLANPGTVAATVNLTIFASDGEVDAPGTDAIIVQPKSERILSLAGFAPDLVSPVVKVESSGGQVVANLQQSTVRILEPGGVDFVGAAAAPSTTTVIPGLVVAAAELVETRVGVPGYQDIEPVLRFFVPGEKPASAVITVDPGGGGEKIAVDFDLMAGRVTELPLGHYEDGSYTVTIASDVPLVAAARVSTVGASGASDFVWLSSAEVIRDIALVNVSPGPGSVLQLSNPETTDAVVTVAPEFGAETTVTVPAGRFVSVPVEESTLYTLDGFQTLRVTVGYIGDGVISGFAVSPTGPASEPITVYP